MYKCCQCDHIILIMKDHNLHINKNRTMFTCSNWGSYLPRMLPISQEGVLEIGIPLTPMNPKTTCKISNKVPYCWLMSLVATWVHWEVDQFNFEYTLCKLLLYLHGEDSMRDYSPISELGKSDVAFITKPIITETTAPTFRQLIFSSKNFHDRRSENIIVNSYCAAPIDPNGRNADRLLNRDTS